ncbi:MAG TPA: Holliday junction resolvase RuvX [Bacteroidales bacterium]|nr:Holliday junction resolvase RuvX [Bacteroidales bacterium]
MGRILAIDYGQKRTGIAVTDELQMIANGLTTVNTNELMPFLKNYFSKENVELLVVGKPMQMNNTESESEKFITPFLKNLQKLFPGIPVKRFDERFTSKMAFQTMIDSGISQKKRRDKALLDTISATIILQSYLETTQK